MHYWSFKVFILFLLINVNLAQRLISGENIEWNDGKAFEKRYRKRFFLVLLTIIIKMKIKFTIPGK